MRCTPCLIVLYIPYMHTRQCVSSADACLPAIFSLRVSIVRQQFSSGGFVHNQHETESNVTRDHLLLPMFYMTDPKYSISCIIYLCIYLVSSLIPQQHSCNNISIFIMTTHFIFHTPYSTKQSHLGLMAAVVSGLVKQWYPGYLHMIDWNISHKSEIVMFVSDSLVWSKTV